MKGWLRDRGEAVPGEAGDGGHHGHGDHAAHMAGAQATHRSHAMMGMATPEQMAELAASEGATFDRMFLKLMIPHHQGAVRMVEELLDLPGTAYDPVLF